MDKIIEQKAIDQALEVIDRLNNGSWSKACNQITKERIIRKIQPLILQAQKANDKFSYPDGFINAVEDAYISGRHDEKDGLASDDFDTAAEEYIYEMYGGYKDEMDRN